MHLMMESFSNDINLDNEHRRQRIAAFDPFPDSPQSSRNKSQDEQRSQPMITGSSNSVDNNAHHVQAEARTSDQGREPRPPGLTRDTAKIADPPSGTPFEDAIRAAEEAHDSRSGKPHEDLNTLCDKLEYIGAFPDRLLSTLRAHGWNGDKFSLAPNYQLLLEDLRHASTFHALESTVFQQEGQPQHIASKDIDRSRKGGVAVQILAGNCAELTCNSLIVPVSSTSRTHWHTGPDSRVRAKGGELHSEIRNSLSKINEGGWCRPGEYKAISARGLKADACLLVAAPQIKMISAAEPDIDSTERLLETYRKVFTAANNQDSVITATTIIGADQATNSVTLFELAKIAIRAANQFRGSNTCVIMLVGETQEQSEALSKAWRELMPSERQGEDTTPCRKTEGIQASVTVHHSIKDDQDQPAVNATPTLDTSITTQPEANAEEDHGDEHLPSEMAHINKLLESQLDDVLTELTTKFPSIGDDEISPANQHPTTINQRQ